MYRCARVYREVAAFAQDIWKVSTELVFCLASINKNISKFMILVDAWDTDSVVRVCSTVVSSGRTGSYRTYQHQYSVISVMNVQVHIYVRLVWWKASGAFFSILIIPVLQELSPPLLVDNLFCSKPLLVGSNVPIICNDFVTRHQPIRLKQKNHWTINYERKSHLCRNWKEGSPTLLL